MVTSSEALDLIRGYAFANRVLFSRHARERMVERGVSKEDVIHALANAVECVPAQVRPRWVVKGADVDGVELTMVVVVEDGVIIITVF